MKRNHALCMILTLIAALLLAAPPALAEEPAAELENGVTWDTTVQEMLDIEGATTEAAPQVYEDGDLTFYDVAHEKDGRTVWVDYVFRRDSLAAYFCDISAYSAQEDEMDAALMKIADSQLLKFIVRYGDPTTWDYHSFAELMGVLGETGIKQEDFILYAGWQFADGTSLHVIYNVFDVVGYVYFNDPLILDEPE